MSVLDTFYLLFKTDAGGAKAEVAALEKQIESLKDKGKKRSEQESKDLKEAVKQHKELTAGLKDQATAADKLKDSLMSAVAAYIGFQAIKAGVVDNANFNRSLGRQSEVIKQNADDMAAYGAAIEVVGGDSQEFFNHVSNLSKSLAQQGVQVKDVKSLMDDYNKTLQNITTQKEKLNYLERFGIHDDATQKLLMLERKEYERVIEMGYKYKITSREAREAAEAWGRQNTELSLAFQQFWRAVDENVLPVLTKLVKKFTEFVDYIGDHKPMVVGAFAAMAAGATALGLAALGALAPWILFAAAIAGAAAALAVLFGNDEDLAKIEKISENISKINATAPGAAAASSGGNYRSNPMVNKEAVAYLQSLGRSRDEAIAMTANLQRESGGNPNARGDGGKAHGLFQWHPDRRAAILAGTGIDVSTASFQDQLKAADWEMKNGKTGFDDQRFRNLNGAAAKSSYFSHNFERPANGDFEAMHRAQMALQIVNDTPLSYGGGSSADRNMSVKIDKIDVNTQATDARGISGAIADHLGKETRSVFANWDDGISS